MRFVSTIMKSIHYRCFSRYFLAAMSMLLLLSQSTLSQDMVENSYFEKGDAFLYNGQCDSAVLYFSKVIELNPQNQIAYNRRGNARYCLGAFMGAIEDYSKCIEITPSDSIDYRNLARAKLRVGDTMGAVSTYTATIELFRNFYAAYSELSEIKLQRGEVDDAIDLLSTVIRLDSTGSYAYVQRARVKYRVQDTIGARQDLLRAIEIDPGRYDARWLLDEFRRDERRVNRQNTWMFESRDCLGIKYGLVAGT